MLFYMEKLSMYAPIKECEYKARYKNYIIKILKSRLGKRKITDFRKLKINKILKKLE